MRKDPMSDRTVPAESRGQGIDYAKPALTNVPFELIENFG